jgi:hypothetical protein
MTRCFFVGYVIVLNYSIYAASSLQVSSFSVWFWFCRFASKVEISVSINYETEFLIVL